MNIYVYLHCKTSPCPHVAHIAFNFYLSSRLLREYFAIAQGEGWKMSKLF